MIIAEAKDGKKLVEYLDNKDCKKVLVVFWHGVGDVAMFNAPLTYVRNKYSHIQIDIGLARGLQEELIVSGFVLLDGNWKDTIVDSDYDLVFSCHMPLEKLNDATLTKAEVCCIEELGIPPICGHLHIKSKPIVGVHFCNTSVSWLANTPEEVAKKIWNEIIDAGCVPIETLFQHAFYNDNSRKFDFVDNHVRSWPARLDTCVSLLAHCDYFIGAVSGNWHIALSVLPYTRVCLLEKDLKVGHFTKLPVKGVDVNNYSDGIIKSWLLTHI